MYKIKEELASSPFHNNAVFFIEIDKIKPNPFQPRREFDQVALNSLADSIRMYGVLQPLVVTRKDVLREDGGFSAEYELIAGERRLRASKIAGLREVPVLIRAKEDDDRVKLELAIIENLQREDLTPIDRAKAFERLANEFGFKHSEIATKVGKSREYVSNSIRLLSLPEDIQIAISEKKISEGHARPLMMLGDRPEEQMVLFKEIMLKKMTVRDAEKVSRRIAYDKVRKKERMFDPDIVELEHEISDVLGTRVEIEQKDQGGKIHIDFFSQDDLRKILLSMKNQVGTQFRDLKEIDSRNTEESIESVGFILEGNKSEPDSIQEEREELNVPKNEENQVKTNSSEDDMYSISNFSV